MRFPEWVTHSNLDYIATFPLTLLAAWVVDRIGAYGRRRTRRARQSLNARRGMGR